ncbi:PucR family transcriptional regulator ligand-binding domain-containing protein [Paenibacillus sp. FSL H8-0537]|uniref:PucR family transcriptional regulator n=1 Tax=Paenibacillus sp. FSL H8-0537 TaxID=2921399 RepID=UPI0031010513
MILADLLKIPSLSGSTVAAGHAGLNRKVSTVNLMDAPDIIHYIKPQELLVTTAYALKDTPQDLVALITSMAAVGCAGLGIKTKRFLAEMPEAAIARANELQFPLIELSLDVSLGDILNQSLGFILEKQTDELRYALESHRHFSNIVLKGQGIHEIVQELAALLSSPTLLFDSKLTLVAASSHFQKEPYSRMLPQISLAVGSLSAQDKESVFCLTAPEPSVFNHVAVHPIKTYQPQGFLVSLQHSYQLQQLPALAMEQAANVISFELLKTQAVKERSRRYKNDLFSDFVDGLVTSEQEMLRRGQRYGLNAGTTSSLCIVAKPDSSADEPANTAAFKAVFQASFKAKPFEEQQLADYEELYDSLKAAFKEQGLSFIIFSKKSWLVLLLTFQPEEAQTVAPELLARISDQVFESSGIPVSFGIGNPVKKLTDIPATYKEAVDAWETAFTSRKRRFVQFYHAKELTDLLRLLPAQELRKFHNDMFKELNRLEDKERSELMRTLVVYHSNNCQIAETAKQLFVHRNTVIYRLEKCEQLTGRKLRNDNDNLRFRIAYLIGQILEPPGS